MHIKSHRPRGSRQRPFSLDDVTLPKRAEAHRLPPAHLGRPRDWRSLPAAGQPPARFVPCASWAEKPPHRPTHPRLLRTVRGPGRQGTSFLLHTTAREGVRALRFPSAEPPVPPPVPVSKALCANTQKARIKGNRGGGGELGGGNPKSLHVQNK